MRFGRFGACDIVANLRHSVNVGPKLTRVPAGEQRSRRAWKSHYGILEAFKAGHLATAIQQFRVRLNPQDEKIANSLI